MSAALEDTSHGVQHERFLPSTFIRNILTPLQKFLYGDAHLSNVLLQLGVLELRYQYIFREPEHIDLNVVFDTEVELFPLYKGTSQSWEMARRLTERDLEFFHTVNADGILNENLYVASNHATWTYRALEAQALAQVDITLLVPLFQVSSLVQPYFRTVT